MKFTHARYFAWIGITSLAVAGFALSAQTPGVTFEADASQDLDGDNVWEDLTGSSGLELLLDDDPAVSRAFAGTTTTQLTHAYDFPGGEVGGEGGAAWVNAGTTAAASADSLGWSSSDVSIELWIKPDNLTPTPPNGQIIFETGGGSGLGLFIRNNELVFSLDSGGVQVAYDLDADSEGAFVDTGQTAVSDFFQVVAVYSVSADTMTLYVNMKPVASSALATDNDWSGSDGAAFGTRGGSNVGGYGGGQQDTESFDGKIGVIRIYSGLALNDTQVADNYAVLSGADTTSPDLFSLSPVNNTTGLYPAVGSLQASFNEEVELTGNGTVTIKNLDDDSGALDIEFTLPSPAVTVSGDVLTIDLTSNLDIGTNYAVRITGDAVSDTLGNAFAGISDDTTWAFSTAVENLNPPVITVKTPDDEEGGVSPGISITVTFDQNVVMGTGNIVIKDLLDDSSTQTIDVTDGSQVSLAGNVVTINPVGILEIARSYAVQIPSTAVRNYSDINFGGITNETDWNFTTSGLVGQLSILDLGANAGLNPRTGVPWQHGDRYRLTFITSTDSYPASADISTYNTEIQALADASPLNLSPVSWSVIGSTATVDARDNTSTNPTGNGNGNGIGFPVLLIDGATVIADNNADLWDGIIHNAINIMDTGAAFDRVPWPYTGTRTDGTARADDGGGPDFAPFGAGGTIGQGTLTNNENWVYRVYTASKENLPYYGMSEPLFVIDTTDSTDPNFSSIVDDVSGGPATQNNPVVFTVTFDEAMLPSTVNAGDFGNAGTSDFTVDEVIQLDDPSVFEVTVTPTTVGTLRLQIIAASDLTDLNGNPLDTGVAINDDTEITVEPESDYLGWLQDYPGLLVTDPSVDADSGGLTNSLEWVLGGDPTDAADDAGIVPVADASDPNNLVFTFDCRDGALDDTAATIVVEYGSDLSGWTVAENGVNGVIIDDTGGAPPAGFKTVQVTLPAALDENGKIFVRLKVEVTLP